MNPILKVLAIEVLPPGVSQTELIEKILRNPEVMRRANELIRKHFSLLVLQSMTWPEKNLLLKDVGVSAAPPARVRWHLGQVPTSGQWFIRATGLSQEMNYTGKPKFAATFRFMGELCPAEIAEEYSRVYRPVGFSQDGDLADAAKVEPQYHAPIIKERA